MTTDNEQVSAATSPTMPQRAKPLWHWYILSASLGPIAAIIIAQLAAWTWYGELASHWTLHATMCLLPVIIVFRRDPWWGRLFFILLIIGCYPWLRTTFAPRATITKEVGQLKVATANLSVDNNNRPAMYPVLRALNADVLILQEVTVTDRSAFLAAKEFPHQEWILDAGPFSLAVLSRHRIVTNKIHRMNNVPMLELLIDGGEAPLRLFAIHPPPPVSPSLTNDRDQYIAFVAQAVKDSTEPVVVAGDWNLSPGASVWHLVNEFTELRSAPGARPATWPAALGPVGISIDHIVGRAVGLTPLTAFTIPGSDHRGIYTTVSLPAGW